MTFWSPGSFGGFFSVEGFDFADILDTYWTSETGATEDTGLTRWEAVGQASKYFEQTTDANEPAYNDTQLNGYPVITPDGTSDIMTASGFTAASGSQYFITVAKLNSTATAANGYILDIQTGRVSIGYASGTENLLFVSAGAVYNSGVQFPESYAVIEYIGESGGDMNIYVNGIQQGSGTTYNDAAIGGNISLFGYFGGAGSLFNGSMPFLGHKAGIPSAANQTALRNALYNKYALTSFAYLETEDGFDILLENGSKIILDDHPEDLSVMNGVTVTYPQQYHVYQRNLPADGTGDIRIVIEYDGIYSGMMEAQFNGGGYEDIGYLTNGTNIKTLSGQAVGNGTFQIRQKSNPGTVTSVTDVAIGIVIGQIGQSNNQAGFATNGQAFSSGSHQCTLFGDGEDTTVDYSRWRVANNSRSDEPLWGQYMVDELGVSVGVIFGSIGGTDDLEWQKTADPVDYGFDDFRTDLNLYNRYLEKVTLAGGIEFQHFFDDTNASIDGRSTADFEDNIRQLANDLFADTGKKLLKSKTHIIANGSQVPYTISLVNTGTENLWAENGNVLQGADYSDLSAITEGAGGDELHLRSDYAQRVLADRFWSAVQKNYYVSTLDDFLLEGGDALLNEDSDNLLLN